MDIQNTNKHQEALVKAQLYQLKLSNKKLLWESPLISQEDAAYLLESIS